MSSRRKFPKSERLRNEIFIADLFKYGKKFYDGSFIFIKLFHDTHFLPSQIKTTVTDLTTDSNSLQKDPKSTFQIQFFAGVRKKDFKHAVKRNRIRRLLKEAYRNNKHLLSDMKIPDEKILLIGILYVGKTIPSYSECSEKIIKFLKKIL